MPPRGYLSEMVGDCLINVFTPPLPYPFTPVPLEILNCLIATANIYIYIFKVNVSCLCLQGKNFRLNLSEFFFLYCPNLAYNRCLTNSVKHLP